MLRVGEVRDRLNWMNIGMEETETEGGGEIGEVEIDGNRRGDVNSCTLTLIEQQLSGRHFGRSRGNWSPRVQAFLVGTNSRGLPSWILGPDLRGHPGGLRDLVSGDF